MMISTLDKRNYLLIISGGGDEGRRKSITTTTSESIPFNLLAPAG
jgi:hypothetical protein